MKITLVFLCCVLVGVSCLPWRWQRPWYRPRACRDRYRRCSRYISPSRCKKYSPGTHDYQWFVKNCQKFCGYCGEKPTTSLPTTAPPLPTTSTVPKCGLKGKSHTRIVGGTLAQAGDWPWQVTYDYIHNTGNPGHWCGASILTPNWIVTAAHCFISKNVDDYTLTVGDFDISKHEGHEQKIKIEKIITHEQYNPTTFDYDIALLKLGTPIKFTNRVRPVCLPDDDMDFPAGTPCFVTGWGKLNETGSFPKHLYQAKVPLVAREQCAREYSSHHGYTITERMRCAGFLKGGIDACQGDSGGPMVCSRGTQWYLMGAVSWGVGCARANAYGVYSDLTVLKSWVIKNMGN